MTCPHCAATARTDATFCGQCHAPLGRPVSSAVLGQLLAGAEQLASPPARFLPRPEAPRVLPTYSRWRSTTTTFGPVGRVAWTLVMALIAAMAVVSQNPFAIGPLCFIAVPVMLRSMWEKGRVG